MGDEHPGYAARLGPVSLTPYLWTFEPAVTGALLAMVTRSILWAG